jgi:Meckel syndrome type 1 protein
MNPNTPPPHDDDLPDEHELAALYARLPKAEPDAALDAAVLSAALRVTPPVRRRPRWPVALGSAAVLVLAVGVGFHLRDTPIHDPVAENAERLAAPAQEPAATPAPAPVEAEAATPAPPPKLIAQSTPPTRRIADTSRVGAHPVRDAVRPTAQALVLAPESLPAPPSPAAPPAPPAPPVPPSPDLTPNTTTNLDQPNIEPRSQAKALKSAPAPMLEGTIAAKPAPLSPDDRVGEIRRLLDQGDRPTALQKLAELRRLYPAYDIPQDLRDLKQ